MSLLVCCCWLCWSVRLITWPPLDLPAVAQQPGKPPPATTLISPSVLSFPTYPAIPARSTPAGSQNSDSTAVSPKRPYPGESGGSKPIGECQDHGPPLPPLPDPRRGLPPRATCCTGQTGHQSPCCFITCIHVSFGIRYGYDRDSSDRSLCQLVYQVA